MSTGGGKQTTTYQPPAEVMAAYKDLMARSQGLLGGQAPQYSPEMAAQYMGYTPGLVAQMTPDQIQSMRNIAGMQGYMDPFVQTGANMAANAGQPVNLMQFSGGQVEKYMSPYLKNVLGSAVANINETNAQQQNQLLGNAISRGAYGGDRAGIAQAQLARSQGLANNATIANILNSGYGQALGMFNTQQAQDLAAQQASRQYALQGAGMLGQLGNLGLQGGLQQAQAQYGAGAAQQQQQQANLSTAYQQYLNQYQSPFNQLNWYGGLVSGVGSGMGGSTTANMPGASPLASIIGIGSMLGGTGGLGSLLGLSDKRTKENIEPVGETYDGQKIYRYNFKGNPKTEIGLIAQEVQKKNPKAVGNMGGGVLGVDYRDATEKAAERGHFEQGGVIPHYADGGTTTTTTMPFGGLIVPSTVASGSGSDAPKVTGSTWGYVAPNSAGDTVTPATRAYQDLASSGKGSYQDLQDSYANYLKSFQAPAGSPLPMVGFDPNKPMYKPDTSTNTGSKSGKSVFSGLATTSNRGSSRDSGSSGSIYDNNTNSPSGYTGGWGNYGSFGEADVSGYGGSGSSGSSGGLLSSIGDALGSLFSEGGAVHKAMGGGLVPQISMDYGLDTPDSIRQRAQSSAGTGLVSDPTTEAMASQGLLAANGGRIHKAPGGPLTGEQPNYQALAEEAARRYNIDPDQYKKLIHGESGWKTGQASYGDEGSSGGLLQMHIAGASQKYPHSGLGDVYIKERNPELAKQGSPQEKLAYLSDPNNQKDLLDWGARYISQKGAKDWTVARNQGLFNAGNPNVPAPGSTPAQGVMPGQEQTLAAKAAAENAKATAQKSSKEGLAGFLPGLDDPRNLALFKFGATLAGTPGPFGYGLAAAANAYADSLISSKRLGTESEKRAAETKREEATAQNLATEALKNRVYPTAVGLFGLTGEGMPPLQMDRFDPSKSQFVESGTAAPAPIKGEVPKPVEGGAPTAPEAPKGPVEIPKDFEFGSIYNPEKDIEHKTNVYSEAVKSSLNNPIAMGTAGPKLQEQFTRMQDAVTDEQKAASQATNDLGTTIRAVSTIPQTGILKQGADQPIRDAIGNYFQTYGSYFGFNPGLSPGLGANQFLEKIAAFQANAQTRGNTAARWLETYKNSMPNAGQQPEVTRGLTAALIVNNKQQQDMGRFAAKYGRDTYNMGTDLISVFNKVHTREEYERDKKAIQKLLGMSKIQDKNGVYRNPIVDLMDGIIDEKTFNEASRSVGGPSNLADYFLNMRQ